MTVAWPRQFAQFLSGLANGGDFFVRTQTIPLRSSQLAV